MTQLTILLSVDPEANRFRFSCWSCGARRRQRRAPSAMGADRNGRPPRRRAVSTVRLAESARAELLERRRRRGYVRADLGADRERPRDGLAPLVAWEVMLAHALERMRRSSAERSAALRSREGNPAQLVLPLAS